jgi:type III secretion protein R
MSQLSDFTGLMIGILAITMVPFVAMVATSYAKIVVVLGLLRNALGVQQVPPNMVLNGIALLVTFYVMAPIGMEAMKVMPHRTPGTDSTVVVTDAFTAGREPFRAFLKQHTREREKLFFLRSAAVIWPKDMAAQLHEDDLIVLAPAFTLTEMTDAFKIGFLLYITFIVVDLIIANLLMAMGLNQVQPTNVAIPFKLLLFVAMDGWSTLIHGLILTYRTVN